MGRIVGIDLGTTYSAVAIPEERPGVDGFLVARGCPGCSVVLDDRKRHITPSVVAEDERGQIVVGHPAKGRAGFTPPPIMFAKRSMGEDTTFPLAKQGVLRAEDVSAHVLRYLKKMAEARLGEPVDEAVITVPAYFSMKAKQMTEKAAEMAGLRVAQIAQEPVAAAIMYCAGDPRDSLRIMTYDLGGGTFDVAILEKRGGVISTESIRAFDGDRFLGGYDFDTLLALWIGDQLCARGYDLQLNQNDPGDKVIFAKLMVYAERAKIALSKGEEYEFQEPVTGINDHSGTPVTLDLAIRRDEFEAMIAKKVEYTIDLCHRALEKAYPELPRPVRSHKLDEILMVGGSSRIPLVGRRLEAEFQKTPKLVEPDLCVALGAALMAGAMRTVSVGCLRLDPVPSQTDMPELVVTGQVVPGGGVASVDRCTVTLRAMDQSYLRSRPLGAEGRFSFEQVPLAFESTTDFLLSVAAPGGAEMAAHRFSVAQSAIVAAGGLMEGRMCTNVLAKPISILLADGLHVVAPERTPLPYENPTLRAKTRDTSGTIRITIHEENNPLGEILIKGIPPTLPVGSAVEITLSIQENFQIRGRGYVPALAREETVVIDLPVRALKGIGELRRNYEIAAEKANDALSSAGRGARFGNAKAVQLKKRMDQCEEMLSEASRGRPAEPAAIQDCLDEIETLSRDIGKRWEPKPSRTVFEEKANQAHELLAKAIKKKPKIAQEGYDKQIEAIQSEADKAYKEQNLAVWKDSYDKLAKLVDRIEDLTDDGDGGGPAPEPAQFLLSLALALNRLETSAKDNGRYHRFQKEFQDLATSLTLIDPKSADAMSQIRDWYRTKFQDLKNRLDAPDTEGIPELD